MNTFDPAANANVLVEALPYIQEYYGQTVVIKYGGNAMINEALKDAVIHDIVLLSLVGVLPVRRQRSIPKTAYRQHPFK